ncbi:hypothetical protein [Streptomyces sp. NPDC003635]
MTDRNSEPVPRDLPDQQAGEGEDPWDIDVDPEPSEEDRGGEVPDADEAGSARKGSAEGANVHPEHPTPEEPSA